jgi:hypothetical protein
MTEQEMFRVTKGRQGRIVNGLRQSGYGNRRIVTCRLCGRKVFDADPGNASGFHYANYYCRQAINQHKTECISLVEAEVK